MFKTNKKLVFMFSVLLLASLFAPLLHNVKAADISTSKIGEKAETNLTILASTYPAWDSSKVYWGGDMVSYNGNDYRAKWWTQGETPGTSEVWELVATNPNPSTPLENGTYRITNKSSGKVLDVTGNSTASGTKIQQWTNYNATNQQFKIEKQSDGYYKISAMHSGLVLDVPNSSTSNSVQLQQWTNNDTNAQRWQITDVGGGYYKVLSKISGLAMDVRSSSKDDGAAVQQYTDNGTDAQKWSFTLVDPTDPTDPPITGFKVVGYYPSWEPGKINTIQYNNLTHINYAFAIPTSDGSLLPLENAEAAKQIIQKAHENGVKVLLAVGGWSYNGTPLESTFMSATSTHDKVVKFGNAIIAVAKQYGFDGVDIDWEHPRTDGTSKQQYEDLMVYLSGELHRNNMLLTAAVLSGVTPDGVVYWDSAAQTDTVISVVDWFNVMAYDGGDGARHSSYDFAINCAKYWRDTRHMPAQKVVLGVPFYGRPSWASYAAILQANPNAYNTDVSMINGVEAYYNGIPTIKAKTQWACDNVGGIMMWELSQDTTDINKSLLNAIGDTVRANQ